VPSVCFLKAERRQRTPLGATAPRWSWPRLIGGQRCGRAADSSRPAINQSVARVQSVSRRRSSLVAEVRANGAFQQTLNSGNRPLVRRFRPSEYTTGSFSLRTVTPTVPVSNVVVVHHKENAFARLRHPGFGVSRSRQRHPHSAAEATLTRP